MSDGVSVAVVANEFEAELIVGALEAEGIPATWRITDFGFGSGGEFPSAGGGPRTVLVREADAARARILLDALEASTEETS